MSAVLSAFVRIAVLAALGGAPALAQNYPTKPIRILIAQAPGSATDVVSRVVGNRLSEGPRAADRDRGAARRGRGGRHRGGGALGARRLHALHGEQLHPRLEPGRVSEAALRRGQRLRAHRLCRLRALCAGGRSVVAGEERPGAVALAKSRPGKMNYASAGNGSTHHFCGELLKSMSGHRSAVISRTRARRRRSPACSAARCR